MGKDWMKKMYCVNLILQALIIAVAWIYAEKFAVGWDGLIILVVAAIATPIILVDIIGLIFYALKNRKQKKIELGQEYERELVEEFLAKENNIPYEDTKIDGLQNDTNKSSTNSKNKLKLVCKIVIVSIIYLLTGFQYGITISTILDSHLLNESENVDNLKDLELKTEKEIIRDIKKKYKDTEYKYMNFIVAVDEIDEMGLEEKDIVCNEYYFKSKRYGFEFKVTQSVGSSGGFLFDNGGYYEHIEDSFFNQYELYIEREFNKSLGGKYNNQIMQIDGFNDFGGEIEVSVIVDWNADDTSINNAKEILPEIAKESALTLKQIDKEKFYGTKEHLGVQVYDVNVSLYRSWIHSDNFRQYDIIGKYYSNADVYKDAKRDLDGIIISEDEW